MKHQAVWTLMSISFVIRKQKVKLPCPVSLIRQLLLLVCHVSFASLSLAKLLWVSDYSAKERGKTFPVNLFYSPPLFSSLFTWLHNPECSLDREGTISVPHPLITPDSPHNTNFPSVHQFEEKRGSGGVWFLYNNGNSIRKWRGGGECDLRLRFSQSHWDAGRGIGWSSPQGGPTDC